jgi:hypothetical protein
MRDTSIRNAATVHHVAESRATPHRAPFDLVYFEEYPSRARAIRREEYLKTKTGNRERHALIRAFDTGKLAPFDVGDAFHENSPRKNRMHRVHDSTECPLFAPLQSDSRSIGALRSPVAHELGVVGVAGFRRILRSAGSQ